MTREETRKLLAIIKAAIPTAYKGMTKRDALMTIEVWFSYFGNIPIEIMVVAADRYIKTGKFAPTIAEIIEILQNIFDEKFIEAVVEGKVADFNRDYGCIRPLVRGDFLPSLSDERAFLVLTGEEI